MKHSSAAYLNAAQLFAGITLVLSFVTLMWFGGSYNDELRHQRRKAVIDCPTLAPRYVLIDVKGSTQCVEATDAQRFQRADKLSQIAIVAGGLCFLFIIFMQRRERSVSQDA